MKDSKEIFFQTEKENWICVWYFPQEDMLRIYFNGYMVDELSLKEEPKVSRLQYIIDREGNRCEV